MTHDKVTEPGADRGPRAGSPRGVVDATGSKIQPYVALITVSLPDPRLEKARNTAVQG
jgi:hypothetical protein